MKRSQGIIAFPDDRSLIAALVKVPIDAVQRDVGDAILEPLDRYRARAKGGVLYLGERLNPVDAAACFVAPKSIRVFHRSLVHFLIFGRVDKGTVRPIPANGINRLG